MEDQRRPVGRPKVELDWDQLDQLCFIQCTQEEIASVMDISEDLLARRIKERYDCNFKEYFTKKASNGKRSLRRRMWQHALGDKQGDVKPNITMMIYLSKNHLGMHDNVQLAGDPDKPFKLMYDVNELNPKSD